MRVWDDPNNAMNLEAHSLPLSSRGSSMRQACEYLCVQTDIDFVVLDSGNHVALNRRLPMTSRMKGANRELAGLLSSGVERAYEPEEIRSAIQSHQKKFGAQTVSY